MKYCHWNPYTIVSSLKEPRYNQEVLTYLVCKSYPSCIVNKPQNVRSHGVRLTAKYFSTNLSVVINPWSIIIIETSVSQVRKLLIERPKAVHSLFLCPDHMLLVPMMLEDWACCSEHSSGASPRMDHSWASIAYRTVSLLSGEPASQEILHCSMLPSAVVLQPRWFLALTSKPGSFRAVLCLQHFCSDHSAQLHRTHISPNALLIKSHPSYTRAQARIASTTDTVILHPYLHFEQFVPLRF